MVLSFVEPSEGFYDLAKWGGFHGDGRVLLVPGFSTIVEPHVYVFRGRLGRQAEFQQSSRLVFILYCTFQHTFKKTNKQKISTPTEKGASLACSFCPVLSSRFKLLKTQRYTHK